MLDWATPYLPGAIVALAFLPFAWRRLLTYLHIFQQEEYDGPRFLRWIWQNAAFDRRASVIILALFGLSLLYPTPRLIVAGFMAAVLVLGIFREGDPRKEGKKKLAMTQRATRIEPENLQPLDIEPIERGLARHPNRSFTKDGVDVGNASHR